MAKSRRSIPTFWEGDHLRLFISHLAVEKAFAAKLKRELSRYEISGFVAHQDIAVTSEWQSEIKQGLLTCDGLVALLHKGFHKSPWTDQEVGYVLGRKRPVCAIELGEKLYGFIGHIQALHGQSKDIPQIAAELFRALCQNPLTAKRLSAVAVARFVKSDSWADASDRLSTLEVLRYWNDESVERVKEAAKTNSQITHGPGIYAETPRRVDRLVAKWSRRPSPSA
ncbi:MAG: toll/interleukin-1 receptor domain-containing protein [Acidobacteriota bacterium]